ncbi:hypothetical protein ACO0LC_16245 [Undibacterium sp. JH2W]|uniref:hypothetical protein n=1 Tax=Undibacterium sp. JH2W TaxID=3413037 RepID=UPI003BF3B5DF
MKNLSLLFAACTLIAATTGTVSAGTISSAVPDLNLRIQYFSKVLTPEGVTREARYEEAMLRRPGHVWVTRSLPENIGALQDDHQDQGKDKKKVSLNAKEEQHKHFNHVLIPRHIFMDGNKPRIEFINAPEKEVIAIPPSEYANVNFDGSWENAFYLLDPVLVKAIPVSNRASTISGARWREREKNGVFQRVLWDEQKQIPWVIESGDNAGTFYRRVDVKLQAATSRELPWQNIKGYAHKEYADFLD